MASVRRARWAFMRLRESCCFGKLLTNLVPSGFCSMFNQQEFQILLGGVNSAIDIEDLRAHTVYGGLYDEKHPTIMAFWNVCQLFF